MLLCNKSISLVKLQSNFESNYICMQNVCDKIKARQIGINSEQKVLSTLPFESFFDIPDWFRKRHAFLRIKPKDIVIAQVISRTSAALCMYIICYDEEQLCSFKNLDIQITCDIKDIAKEASDSIGVNDLVRCAIVSVNTVNMEIKATLSLAQVAGPGIDPMLKLGLISKKELPETYWIINDSTVSSLHSYYKEQNKFLNSASYDNYCSNLLIDKSQVTSLLHNVKSMKIDSTQFGSHIRKSQLNKVALRSVAKGVDLFRKGDIDAALECYNAALSVATDNTEALVARGALYVTKRLFDEAIADFNSALQAKPDHKNAKLYLAKTYVAIGKNCMDKQQHEEAITYLRFALNYDPALSVAQTLLLDLIASNKLNKVEEDSQNNNNRIPEFVCRNFNKDKQNVMSNKSDSRSYSRSYSRSRSSSKGPPRRGPSKYDRSRSRSPAAYRRRPSPKAYPSRRYSRSRSREMIRRPGPYKPRSPGPYRGRRSRSTSRGRKFPPQQSPRGYGASPPRRRPVSRSPSPRAVRPSPVSVNRRGSGSRSKYSEHSGDEGKQSVEPSRAPVGQWKPVEEPSYDNRRPASSGPSVRPGYSSETGYNKDQYDRPSSKEDAYQPRPRAFGRDTEEPPRSYREPPTDDNWRGAQRDYPSRSSGFYGSEVPPNDTKPFVSDSQWDKQPPPAQYIDHAHKPVAAAVPVHMESKSRKPDNQYNSRNTFYSQPQTSSYDSARDPRLSRVSEEQQFEEKSYPAPDSALGGLDIDFESSIDKIMAESLAATSDRDYQRGKPVSHNDVPPSRSVVKAELVPPPPAYEDTPRKSGKKQYPPEPPAPVSSFDADYPVRDTADYGAKPPLPRYSERDRERQYENPSDFKPKRDEFRRRSRSPEPAAFRQDRKPSYNYEYDKYAKPSRFSERYDREKDEYDHHDARGDDSHRGRIQDRDGYREHRDEYPVRRYSREDVEPPREHPREHDRRGYPSPPSHRYDKDEGHKKAHRPSPVAQDNLDQSMDMDISPGNSPPPPPPKSMTVLPEPDSLLRQESKKQRFGQGPADRFYDKKEVVEEKPRWAQVPTESSGRRRSPSPEQEVRRVVRKVAPPKVEAPEEVRRVIKKEQPPEAGFMEFENFIIRKTVPQAQQATSSKWDSPSAEQGPKFKDTFNKHEERGSIKSSRDMAEKDVFWSSHRSKDKEEKRHSSRDRRSPPPVVVVPRGDIVGPKGRLYAPSPPASAQLSSLEQKIMEIEARHKNSQSPGRRRTEASRSRSRSRSRGDRRGADWGMSFRGRGRGGGYYPRRGAGQWRPSRPYYRGRPGPYYRGNDRDRRSRSYSRSKSRTRSRSRSYGRKRSRSPVRRRSRSPFRPRSRSPVRQRSKSPSRRNNRSRDRSLSKKKRSRTRSPPHRRASKYSRSPSRDKNRSDNKRSNNKTEDKPEIKSDNIKKSPVEKNGDVGKESSAGNKTTAPDDTLEDLENFLLDLKKKKRPEVDV